MALNDVGQFFISLFSQVWRVLDLQLPVFNLTVWQFWVGAFLIGLSIKVLRSFLGNGSTYESNSSGRYPRKGE